MKWTEIVIEPIEEDGESGVAVGFISDYLDQKQRPLYIGMRIHKDRLPFINEKGLPAWLRQEADRIDSTVEFMIEQEEAKKQEQAPKVESPIKSLVCEVCKAVIAKFDVCELAMPVMGSMFKSKDPDHGVPDPFDPRQDWRYMRCPYCKRRPFIIKMGDTEAEVRGPSKVLTPEGWVEIEPEGAEPPPLTEPVVIQDDPARHALAGAETNTEYDPLTSETQPTEVIGLQVDEFALSGEEPQETGLWGVSETELRQEGEKKRNQELKEIIDGYVEHQYTSEDIKPKKQIIGEHDCPICGKPFTKHMSLVAHMRVHSKKVK